MKLNATQVEGSLLAGVCAGLAQAFQWNVWVLRGLFVAFLLIKTFWALVSYAVLAVIFMVFQQQFTNRSEPGEKLSSPELSARGERIADLEKQFRDLENRG